MPTPTPADIRAQILLQLRGEGTGVADSIRQEMERLKGIMQGTHDAFVEGNVSIRDYLTTMKPMEQELVRLAKELEASEAAIRRQAEAAEKLAEINQKVRHAEMMEGKDDNWRVRQYQGLNREQEHLNTLIAEGAQLEAEATTVTMAHAGAMTRAASAGESLAKSKTNLGMTILATSYAVQDFTSSNGDMLRGLMAVQNNVPIILAGLGVGPGLAGAISVVSVGLGVLAENWEKIEDKFNIGIPTPVLDSTKQLGRDLKEASSEFEKLAEKTRLSLPELNRFKELNEQINRLEKEREDRRKTEAIEAIAGKEEAERGSAFKQAIAAAGGGDKATQDLIDALANVGMATGQQFTMQGIVAQAEKLMRDAAEGDKAARDEIVKAIGYNPQTQRGFAAAIEQFSPERKAMIEQIDKANREEADAIAEGARFGAEAARQAAEADREAQRQAKDEERQAQRDEAERQRDAAKAAREAAAAARKAPAAAMMADRGAIARKLQERFPGASPEQAMEGAELFQRRRDQGDNPVLAQAKTEALLTDFVRQNLMTTGQMTGFTAQLEMMIGMATRQLEGIRMQIQMAEGRLRAQAVRQPWPMNTIPQ